MAIAQQGERGENKKGELARSFNIKKIILNTQIYDTQTVTGTTLNFLIVEN